MAFLTRRVMGALLRRLALTRSYRCGHNQPVKVPELLAPAGSPEKLKVAFHYGADAVYLGLKRFSLRSFIRNFSEEELVWALDYAHERGRKVYVALNVQPFDPELAGIEEALRELRRIRPDAVIVADPGVLRLARRAAPELELHLSTQASVTNAAAAEFWFDQGIHRIVLARELHLDHLSALVPAVSGELEVFVHGAVCVAWSGRCFLSLYWARRDPRHGQCAQGCRWPYHLSLEEARNPGRVHRVSEDERGTYFFDARDLCALPVLDRLVGTGVRALKIEGRTRSQYYLGVTVDVYRQALDVLATDGAEAFEAGIPAWQEELARACKRGFSTHFLTGEQDLAESYLPGGSPVGGKPVYLGKVVATAPGEHVDVELRYPIERGAEVELRDRGMGCERTTAEVLRTADGEPLERARHGQIIRLPGAFRAGVGAFLRLADVSSKGCHVG